ncbi:hypothetical protein J6G99_01375 [bacterium]|nr:hypothetical protein [bacterium]
MKVEFSISTPNVNRNFLNSYKSVSFCGANIAKNAGDTFIKKSAVFNPADFFIPLKTLREEISCDIDAIKDEISDKLLKKMKDALDENNFYLKKVYEINAQSQEPSKKMSELFKKSENIISRYSSIPEMTYKDINNFANKYAVKESHYWKDFKEMTKDNIWMPMRFIRHKYSNPASNQYNTQKLTDLYLYNLYSRGYSGYILNPLARFDSQKLLSKEIVQTINYLYMTIYKNPNLKFDNAEFKSFASRFDKNGIGKSIENMEHVYRKHFMDNYRTGKRKMAYDKKFQEALVLIREKLDFAKVNREQNFKTLKKPEWFQPSFF